MRTNIQSALSSFVVPTFDVVRPDPEDEWIQDLARKYNRTPDDVADIVESIAHTITERSGEQAVMSELLRCTDETMQLEIELRREREYQRARLNARKEQMRRKGRKGRR